MKKIFKEPLFHFLLIGAGLFLVYAWARSDEAAASSEQIVVSQGRIEQLSTVFQKTWQRPPTPDELKGMIDDFVLEEIYYRQAVEMGIDRDDTIIRRRLRQKLEFLTDDAVSLTVATNQQLASYLAENSEKFREAPNYSFRQIYFNPESMAEKPEGWIAQQLEGLQAGNDQIGDPTLLPATFDQASARAVDGTFGIGFSQELDQLQLDKWQGPIRSGLGAHFVLLEARTAGRLPKLDEIRPTVEREWSNQQRLSKRMEVNNELLKNYQVVIEWPKLGTEDSDAGEGGEP